jgi:hypothetical protein
MLGQGDSAQSKTIMCFDKLPKADVLFIELRTGKTKPADFALWRANAQRPWNALPPKAYLGGI